MTLAGFGDGVGKGGSGASLSVETRLEVRLRDGEDDTLPSSTMVDILRDFPETADEELVRVEDREGVRVVSDTSVSSCSFVLNVSERLRRDRALFAERREDGYRSAIAEAVSGNESTCPRWVQTSQGQDSRAG